MISALWLATLAWATPDDDDRTHLFLRQSVAAAGWPSGLLADARAELRTPLHRSASLLFRDTYAGVGARVAATPVFLEAGPRVSFAPVDVFDVDLTASWVSYWRSAYGVLPMPARSGTLEVDRKGRREETVAARGLVLHAAPTLKARLGPLVLVDAWVVRHHRITPLGEADASLMYEPFTDLVVGWTDTLVEHQPVVLYEVLPDDGRAWLRVGPTLRDRFSVASGDRSVAAGLLVATRPGATGAVPTVAALCLAYLRDDDRGPAARKESAPCRACMPFLGVQAVWIARPPVGGGGP